MKQGDILERYLRTNKINKVTFAKELGVVRSTLYNLFEEEKIEEDYLKKIKAILKTDIFAGHVSHLPVKNEKAGIPVYDTEFTAGNITQLQDFPELVVGFIHFASFKNCVAFVKVKGNSMFPTFTAGDLIGLEPQEDFKYIEYGQPYAVVTKQGQSMVKIIRKGKDNEHLILRSNNKEFDDIDLHRSDISRLYKAHGPIRDTFY